MTMIMDDNLRKFIELCVSQWFMPLLCRPNTILFLYISHGNAFRVIIVGTL